MKKIFALPLIAAAVSLSACGSKSDANAKNFGAVISQYLAQEGDLHLGVEDWPVELRESDIKSARKLGWGKAKQITVLESIGLVKGEEVEEDVTNFKGQPTGRKRKFTRYTLSDAAKPFTCERKRFAGSRYEETLTDLCWGKKALDKVVKWDAPMSLGEYKMTEVTYIYKIENLAEWANNPEVQEAFPRIKKILDEDKEAALNVHLTSEGWEAGRSGF
ncbi:MAG: hypothetical protein IKU14_00095 [Rhodocyclaceae bacterium]|nr:hypothetical protein [Rhodocyclaceae bacterium]